MSKKIKGTASIDDAEKHVWLATGKFTLGCGTEVWFHESETCKLTRTEVVVGEEVHHAFFPSFKKAWEVVSKNKFN